MIPKGAPVAQKVYGSISVSLDGFITGPNDRPGRPLGDRGEVLHDWMAGLNHADRVREVDVLQELFAALGALVVGRRGFDISETDWGDEPPFRCPVFVLTHRPMAPITRGETTYVFVDEGFDRALDLARRAAGTKHVGLHGATPVQQALRAGVLDELQLHLVPVLLGSGRRLFAEHADPPIRLERVRTIDGTGVTHLKFRVPR
jgi:dihydrofolate reductase